MNIMTIIISVLIGLIAAGLTIGVYMFLDDLEIFKRKKRRIRKNGR